MNLADVRDGLAERLKKISGLRVHDHWPGDIEPPAAIVGFPERVEFDGTMGRGVETFENIGILVVLGRADERAAEEKLEEFLSKTGARSIKATVEGDRTLDGACQALRVTEARNFGPVKIAGVDYLGVEFLLTVHG